MSELPFMNWYTADYARDTKHLTLEQDAAYRRMIDAMWDAGGRLPNNDSDLARILRIDVRKWKFLSTAVLPFFVVDGNDLTHKRVSIELAKATARSERAAAAGRQGGRPKKDKAEPAKPNGPRGVSRRNHRGFRGETPASTTADLSQETAENKETEKATAKLRARATSTSESESNLPSLSTSSANPEPALPSSDQPPSLRNGDGGAAAGPHAEKVTTAKGSAVSIGALVDSILGRGPPVLSAEKAVLADAEKRLAKAVIATGMQVAGELIDMFGTDPPTYAVAIEAEANAPGGGLKIALTMLDQHRENLGPIIAGCAPAWRMRLDLDAATLRASTTTRTLQ